MNLPYSRDAEIGVVGACLDGGLETTLEASEKLPARCFYHDDAKFVYECIQSSANHGQMIDVIGLIDKWKAIYPALAFPAEFYDAQDKHGKYNLSNRIETVLDTYRRRVAMEAASQLVEKAEQLSEPIFESIAEFESSIDSATTNAAVVLDGKQLGHQLTDDLEKRSQLNGALSGIDTGFSTLNRYTDGLQAGEVWVIGARPSVGKTAFALNVAEHVAFNQGIPCLFVSLEMSAVALARRLLAMRGKISGRSIRSGTFTQEEFKAMAVFSHKLKESPLYIVDSPGGIKVTQLCHTIRAAIKRWGIKVVFLDYMQKIRPDSRGEKRTYEIGDTSSQLVELTKREKINLFALAQLNRENEKDKGRPPRLSDLADSKSIEADADFVGLLDRPIGGDETRASLRIAKQRDGERGTIWLEFQGAHCRFSIDERTHE